MEVIPLGNDKFQVLHDGYMDVLTLDEVMFLLSRPVPTVEKQKNEKKDAEKAARKEREKAERKAQKEREKAEHAGK